MSDGFSEDLSFGSAKIEPVPGEAEDDPVESSQLMKEEAEKEASTDVDAPEESCKKPWLEVTILGQDDKPVGSIPYKVDLPSLQTAGTLDGDGFVHVDKVEEAAGEVTVRLLEETDSSGTSSYSLEIVSKESQPEEEREESLDPSTDVHYPPFEPY